MCPHIEGFGKQLVQRNYPYSGAPLLRSFYLRFTSSDRHIDGIVVEPGTPSPDKITIGYYDESRNDEFFYKTFHHSLVGQGITTDSIESVANGRETVSLNKPAGDAVFVLTGFALYFRGNDHHVDEIGILEEDGKLTVSYNDKNDDDTFLWRAHYAWIPRQMLTQIGSESRTRARGGERRAMPQGIPVIRGFRVDFQPYFTSGNDHHLREVGVLTGYPIDGFMEVYYSDKNADDGFDWEVRWAILSQVIGPYIPIDDWVVLALDPLDEPLLPTRGHEQVQQIQ